MSRELFRRVLVSDFSPARTPFGRSRAFQNGSARTRSDTDAAHMRKAPGVTQMRQTMQMQIDENAFIRN